MSTKPTEARAALNMMGIQPNGHATAAMMYGWLAAEAFAAMIDHDHGSDRESMIAHNEFGEAFASQLASAGGDIPAAWSITLSLLGTAIPTPAVTDPMPTPAAPYAALRLASACCTILSNPDDDRRVAPAVATVQEVVRSLITLAGRDHLLSSARQA